MEVSATLAPTGIVKPFTSLKMETNLLGVQESIYIMCWIRPIWQRTTDLAGFSSSSLMSYPHQVSGLLGDLGFAFAVEKCCSEHLKVTRE